MRLFVAITPDYDAQRAIGQYVAAFLAGRVQTPVIPENLHVTLRFIGEVSAARLPEIERALSGVEMQAPSIAIEAVAAFPQRKPHTVVGLLARDAGLIALVDAVNAALEPIVPLTETRPFIGHVTLVRVERRHLARLGELRDFSVGWSPGAFALFESQRRDGELHYARLLSVPFVG